MSAAALLPMPAHGIAKLRLAIVLVVLAAWETLSASGLLFRDVIPSLLKIGAALGKLLASADFYGNLGVTAGEISVALLIGGTAGLAVGITLGANRFLSHAFESLLLYLGPTPKIIFFPVMIMWFASARIEGRDGRAVVLLPVAMPPPACARSTVLIRVGHRATTWQMVTKIYLHVREPIINGVRLGLGVAIVGTLLAETKLSNRGLGYLVIQAYALFDMPKMYALVIVLFVLDRGQRTDRPAGAGRGDEVGWGKGSSRRMGRAQRHPSRCRCRRMGGAQRYPSRRTAPTGAGIRAWNQTRQGSWQSNPPTR
jgi:ABC-type nitrate/sulfonate/bicarbonate transport system permease component